MNRSYLKQSGLLHNQSNILINIISYFNKKAAERPLFVFLYPDKHYRCIDLGGINTIAYFYIIKQKVQYGSSC